MADRPVDYLASKYGTTPAVMKRYVSLLTKDASMAMTERAVEKGEYVLDNVEAVMNRLQVMLESCDEWLRDPDDPHRYNLNPRDYEIEVVYEEQLGNGKTIRKKALLSDLLKTAGKSAVEVKYKVADPRNILISVSDSIEKQLRLLSQIQGKIKTGADEVTALVLVKIQQVVIKELKDHPSLRKRIADAFERIQ